MYADVLIDTLNFIAPLSERLQAHFQRYVIEEKLPRKHHLLKEGQVAKKLYFIKKGFARAYYYTADGKECTTWFMGERDIMISVLSFYMQQPAAENIELLEDSIVLSMTWQQLHTIYAEHPEFNYIGRLVTEKYYILSEERAVLLRTLTAKERYDSLLATHPSLLQKASLAQIASFLGISAETLSRVRSKP